MLVRRKTTSPESREARRGLGGARGAMGWLGDDKTLELGCGGGEY
jgi:hypothetical protein